MKCLGQHQVEETHSGDRARGMQKSHWCLRDDPANAAGVSVAELKEEGETLSSPLNINARP